MMNVFSLIAFSKPDSRVEVNYDAFEIQPFNLTKTDCLNLVERIYGSFIKDNFEEQSGGNLLAYTPLKEPSTVCLTDFFLYLNAWLFVIAMVTCYVFRRGRDERIPEARRATKSEWVQTPPELSMVVLSAIDIEEEEQEEDLDETTLPEYEEIIVENGVDVGTNSIRNSTVNLNLKDSLDFYSLDGIGQLDNVFELHGTCEDSGSEEEENDKDQDRASVLFDQLVELGKVEKQKSSDEKVSQVKTESPTKTPSKTSKNFLTINIENVKQLTPSKNPQHRLCKTSDSESKIQIRKSGIPVRKGSHQKLPFSP